uniref:Uncharacterized protein n=1 Tax=Magallana gigas TaxID=29159 RepID=K1RH21_MAGGI
MYKLRLRQSYLSFGAFGCYGVSLLFFIICFCSNHWWYLQLDGKVINMGLWTGCWSSTSGESKCSSSIFDDKHFQNGGGSDWYHGARILMTCSLIAIFLQEFALIGYLCINEVEKYRQKLAGAVLGFSAVIEGAVGVAIFLERKYKHDQKKTLDTENETKSSVHDSKPHNLDPAMVNFWPDPHPRDDLSFSYRSSTGSLNIPYVPDNLSIDTVSTDVVKYTEEPGSSKRGHLEWEV